MLVLSRRENEKVIIDPKGVNIVLTVVRIDRGKVRIGIEAPDDLPIYREELLQRIGGFDAVK